jgi:hypothetical protein
MTSLGLASLGLVFSTVAASAATTPAKKKKPAHATKTAATKPAHKKPHTTPRTPA